MHELDIRLVRCFVTVANERSFTRAAERLRIAQPWLSVQIRRLEEQLGFQLFDRNRNRAVIPTAEAEEFLTVAQNYLVASERAIAAARRIREHASVLLTVGAPELSADLPLRAEIIDDFLVRHPKIEIEIANAWTVELIKRLGYGEIDMAFTLGPHNDPHTEALVLARYRSGILAPAECMRAVAQPLSLAALAGREIAVFRRNINPDFHDSRVSCLEAAGIIVKHLPEPALPAIAHFVQRTGVPALIGEWQGSVAHSTDHLCFIPLDEPGLEFGFNLVRRIGDRRPAVTALWTFALNSLSVAA